MLQCQMVYFKRQDEQYATKLKRQYEKHTKKWIARQLRDTKRAGKAMAVEDRRRRFFETIYPHELRNKYGSGSNSALCAPVAECV